MMKLRRLPGILWHPHQKLWNWSLVWHLSRLPAGNMMVSVVICIDSLLLGIYVLGRRLRKVGLQGRLPSSALYVDCGTHVAGLEVVAISRWFGERFALIAFEASEEHYHAASRNLENVPALDLRHHALVGASYAESTIKLYKTNGAGKDDSLFAQRGERYEIVPAIRLSTVLREFYRKHGEIPTILRMNIEGAESFVLDDLAAAGMLSRIAGFYGMWDDLSKIDPAGDRAFRRFLRSRGIHRITFNERDLQYSLRKWAIRFDIRTSLMHAASSSA